MGVPKQVAEMEAEGDRELEQEVVATQESPVVNEPVDPKPEVVAENPAEPKESLLSKIGEHQQSAEEAAQKEKERQREASAAGRLNKLQGDLRAQRESYEAKIAELEARVADLDGKLKSVKIGDAPSRNDETDEELFAEIRKEYDESDYSDDDLKRFISVINRVGNRNNNALKKIQQRFDEMDAERAERAKSAAKAEADSFVAKLNDEFPGFRDIDAKNDPRWIQFLATDVGGVMEGTTYQDIATDALKTLNYRKFSSVVREFARQSGIVFSPNGNPADASIVGQIRPDGVAASEREQKKAQPRIVSAAEIAEFRHAAFARKAEEKYGMTAKQVDERLRYYEDAEAEGRVR